MFDHENGWKCKYMRQCWAVFSMELPTRACPFPGVCDEPCVCDLDCYGFLEDLECPNNVPDYCMTCTDCPEGTRKSETGKYCVRPKPEELCATTTEAPTTPAPTTEAPTTTAPTTGNGIPQWLLQSSWRDWDHSQQILSLLQLISHIYCVGINI